MTPEAAPHPVYPGGPDCNPNCPGEHSMYHDGYADGYENAEAAAGTALDVERLRSAIRSGIVLWIDDHTEQDSEAELWQFIAAEYARLAGVEK